MTHLLIASLYLNIGLLCAVVVLWWRATGVLPIDDDDYLLAAVVVTLGWCVVLPWLVAVNVWHWWQERRRWS